MTEKDLPTLIAEQRQLLQEKSVILELLKKVRDEMHKLQVEQLQLDSMILTENGSRERDTRGNVPAENTDMDSENVNEEELDLTVSSALNNMLHGQFFAEEEEEEEEEDEQGNYTQNGPDEDEFILPL